MDSDPKGDRVEQPVNPKVRPVGKPGRPKAGERKSKSTPPAQVGGGVDLCRVCREHIQRCIGCD